MKNTVLFLLTITLFCFAKCNKDKIDSNGLPPATQEGKNTLGFLLNGSPWKPQGIRGTGNLSIDYDPNFNQGIFNIVAYNFIPAVSEQFTIGIKDSLNFMNSPLTFYLNRNGLYGISFSKNCDYFSSFTDVQSSGGLTITKLDRSNRIISGIFYATLAKTNCDTVKITQGRFDMKY